MLTKHVVRAAASGALAIGLLTTAPTLDLPAQGAESAQRTQSGQSGAAEQERFARKKKKLSHRKRTARKIATAFNIARKQKGDPYRYGASGPGAFDCSGLTYYSFRRAGFSNIPRTSSAQSRWTKRISRSHMRRGDLMFFHGRGGVYHVGIFAGAAQGRRYVLHAPSTGGRVRTERVWTDSWFPGTLRHR